jgi:hypothetical protein
MSILQPPASKMVEKSDYEEKTVLEAGGLIPKELFLLLL